MTAAEVMAKITPRARVTIEIGRNRREYKEATGKAVMRSTHGGWVLNMGGKYGTPGIADETNIVAVGKFRKTK